MMQRLLLQRPLFESSPHQHEYSRHDYRMVGVACTVWAAMLATHALTEYVFDEAGRQSVSPVIASIGSYLFGIQQADHAMLSEHVERAQQLGQTGSGKFNSAIQAEEFAVSGTHIAYILLAGIAVLCVFACVLIMTNSQARQQRYSIICEICVIVVAAICACIACFTTDVVQYRDIAFQILARGNQAVVVRATVGKSAIATQIRGSDCQAELDLQTVTAGGVLTRSTANVTVFLQQPKCAQAVQGSSVEITGKLQRSQYGKMALWMISGPYDTFRVIRPAAGLRAVLNAMQQRFISATEKLSEQGRILVPGVTIGVLGHNLVNQVGSEPVDHAYASALKQQFAQSGIIHIIAVSGGHFVLIAAAIRRLCATWLLPRYITALCTAVGYYLLSEAMYPSESISRAFVMGVFAVCTHICGRRFQAISGLSWTIIVVLMSKPAMASSIGFAMSSVAVLGIVMCSHSIERQLPQGIPKSLANALAVTVSAQLFTLPLQTLISDRLPLYSIPANIIVAPIASLATLIGLCGFVIASIHIHFGFMVCLTASYATKIMQLCAQWLGSGEMPTVPWSGTLPGVMVVCVAELVFFAVIMAVKKVYQHRNIAFGKTFHSSPLIVIQLWMEQTYRMLR